MKSFLVLFAVATFALQAKGQIILGAPAPATIVYKDSTASTLADTLSLLTVSSLLAETLPYGAPGAIIAPGCSTILPEYPIVPAYPNILPTYPSYPTMPYPTYGCAYPNGPYY